MGLSNFLRSISVFVFFDKWLVIFIYSEKSSKIWKENPNIIYKTTYLTSSKKMGDYLAFSEYMNLWKKNDP